MNAGFRFVRFAKDSSLYFRFFEPFRPCTVREDILFWRTLFLLPFVCMLEAVGSEPDHDDAAEPAAGDPIAATRERYREREREDL